METTDSLRRIRTNLFYGLLDYTKSFPDFSIPQRFTMVGPREGKGLLAELGESLKGEDEILLYVHLPYCSSECVFCNAFPQKSHGESQEKYLDRILEEIDIYSSCNIFDEVTVKCLYLGGGTPTSFSNDAIRQIIQKLTSSVSFSEKCSITCEAHIKDILGNDRLCELAQLGINRISIGCQTFNAEVLKHCRRFHRASQVKDAVRQAKQLGLATNLDMMTGLPGQSLESVQRDLEILGDIAPDSIEYMRHEIVNPQAMALFRENPDLLVADDALFWMTYQTHEWMEENGYEQNGSFTPDNRFPYRYLWLKEMPFLSLGSRSRSHTRSICCDKHEDLYLYLRLIEKGMPPIARYVILDEKEQMYRSLFLSLQVRDGLNLEDFARRFGENAVEVFSSLLDRLGEWGCVELGDSSIKLTRYGRFFVEDVCCFIMDEAVRDGGDGAEQKRLSHSSGGYTERLALRRKDLESR
jgi:oxygen-independent coproporphyrinogen-3 oxidase